MLTNLFSVSDHEQDCSYSAANTTLTLKSQQQQAQREEAEAEAPIPESESQSGIKREEQPVSVIREGSEK